MKNPFRNKKLEERVQKIENALFAENDNVWNFPEIQTILNKTDLKTDMEQINIWKILEGLRELETRFGDSSYEEFLALRDKIAELGYSDFYRPSDKDGGYTLGNRLDVIEGCIDIIHQSHLNQTNSDDTEFKNMHGFSPVEIQGDLIKKVAGIQKSIDLIVKILAFIDIKDANAQKLFTMLRGS